MFKGSRIVKAVLLLLLSVASVTPAVAEEQKPIANASVAFLSQYIWRGQELSHHSLVIQPSLTLNYLGVSANVWSNLDTDYYGETSGSLNETDLTLSCAHRFGPVNLPGRHSPGIKKAGALTLPQEREHLWGNEYCRSSQCMSTANRGQPGWRRL